MNQIQLIKTDIFVVSVIKFHIEEWKNKKDHILGMIPSENDAEKHIKFTDYFESNSNEYKSLILELFKPYILEFHKIAKYKFNGVTSIWCQKYNSRDYHVPHDHGSLGYSCIFYAKMNQEHKGTLFFSPFNNEEGYHETSSIPVVEGDLIIFPSNLMHMAPPHDSDEERVIISLNLS